jgi:hypothetical protein
MKTVTVPEKLCSVRNVRLWTKSKNPAILTETQFSVIDCRCLNDIRVHMIYNTEANENKTNYFLLKLTGGDTIKKNAKNMKTKM